MMSLFYHWERISWAVITAFPASLLALDITFMSCVLCCRPGGQPVQIVHRFHFASHLKRMSVVVRIQEKFYAFIKVRILRDEYFLLFQDICILEKREPK